MTKKPSAMNHRDLENLEKWAKKFSSEDLADLGDDVEGGTRSKKSFSLSVASEKMFKLVSFEYDITQGDIMDLAPFLFHRIAEKSMERRRKSLDTLNMLAEQISRTLETMTSMSPHMNYAMARVGQLLDDLLKIERQSIESGNIKGLDDAEWSEFSDKLHPFGSHDQRLAYEPEMEEFLGTLDLRNVMAGLIPEKYRQAKDDDEEGE